MLKRAQFEFLARESFAGFKRRKLTTGVTILIMSSSLLVLAVLTLATLNLGHLLESARSSIDIRIFLREGLANEQVAELQPRLMVIPGVDEVSFITPEAALNEFRSSLGEEADILDLVEANPLPASFHLTLGPQARNLASVQAIRDEVGVWPEVAEIVFNQAWVDALEAWAFRFQVASLIVGLVVFFAAVFVISNTVKLTMAASARVISIQKLVGATNAFIRTPYVMEGVIQGLLAGLLAMGVLAGAGYILQERVDNMVFFSPQQIAGFIVFCMLLGLIGAWSAMRKYLVLGSEI
jgi:cell division transport system permease protein